MGLDFCLGFFLDLELDFCFLQKSQSGDLGLRLPFLVLGQVQLFSKEIGFSCCASFVWLVFGSLIFLLEKRFLSVLKTNFTNFQIQTGKRLMNHQTSFLICFQNSINIATIKQ